MISVIRMSRVPDDVVIDEISLFEDSIKLKHLYNFVKVCATAHAKEYSNALVEMGEYLGLPHASIYVENVIEHQIFATIGEPKHER